MITNSSFASLMRWPRALVMTLAMLAVASYGQNTASNEWSAALNSPELFIKTGSIEKRAPRSVLLVGESHVGVESQEQLVALLKALYKAHELDAILVEGSYGPITAEDLKRHIDKYSNTQEFWKGQLELGHIAADEYIALTQHGVPMFGVEDMEAKRQFTIGEAAREAIASLKQVIDTHKHGLELARQVSASLNSNALSTANVNEEVRHYENEIAELAALLDKDGARYAEAVRSEAAGAEALKELYGKYASEKAASADPRYLQASAFVTAHEEAEQLGKNFKVLETAIEDQFFIVVNSLREAAGGTPVPSLQTFLRDEDEREWANEWTRAPEDPYLADRNRHMVSNTMDYLAKHPGTNHVVLIVGDLHREQLTGLLQQQNVNVLAGRLTSATARPEPWELQAGNARSFGAERLFTAGSNRPGNILQSKVFREETPRLLAHLASVRNGGQKAIISGNTRIFEIGPGRFNKKLLVVTPNSSGLRADWGPYVLGTGALPDAKGEHYLIIDHELARQVAKESSTETTLFATVYPARTDAGIVKTNIDLPGGSVPIDEFQAHILGSDNNLPERVVLAPIGDARSINTVLASGDFNPPKPPSKITGTASDELPGRRRTTLLFTKNIERAREHMDLIEKQDPLRIGLIASFVVGLSAEQETNLQNSWFTPTRGDHTRAFLIAGENTPEFRKRLREAAADGLFKNKQVALATCFDPKETDDLREDLLEAGALMVWTPENRISPETARKLQRYMEKVDTASHGNPPKGLDDFMERALVLWQRETPDDPDLVSVRNASRWTELHIPIPTMLNPSMNQLSQQLDIPQNGL